MKLLLNVLFFSSLLSASMLLKNENRCIEDYYYDSNRNLVYLDSLSNTWFSSNAFNNDIVLGFDFNTTASICQRSDINRLGLTDLQYNFLIALVGFAFGAIFMGVMNNIFTKVASK
jgi:hypothetical protein